MDNKMYRLLAHLSGFKSQVTCVLEPFTNLELRKCQKKWELLEKKSKLECRIIYYRTVVCAFNTA